MKGKGGAEAQACQKVPDDVRAAAQQHMDVAPQQKRPAVDDDDDNDDDDVQEVQPSKQSRLSCGSSASRASMQAPITDSVQHRMPCLSAASPSSTCSGTLPGTRCKMQPERQGPDSSLSATTPSRQLYCWQH